MVEENIAGVEFLGVNTDSQALKMCNSHRLLQIGEKLTQGLGAGAVPEIGEKAAREAAIKEQMEEQRKRDQEEMKENARIYREAKKANEKKEG